MACGARRLFRLAFEHKVPEQRGVDARRDEDFTRVLTCARAGRADAQAELIAERHARRGSEAAGALVSPQLSAARAETPVDSGASTEASVDSGARRGPSRQRRLCPMVQRRLLLDGRCGIDRDGAVFGTAAVLEERVLLVGGWTGLQGEYLRGVQQLKPGACEFTPGVQLAEPRAGCVAVELGDGRLLVAGGLNATGVLRGSELLTLSRGGGTAVLQIEPAVRGPSLVVARAGCAAAGLGSGRIVVIGGFDERNSLETTEILDPGASAFVPGPCLARPRGGCAAVRLRDGRVLVVGGVSGSEHLASTEVLDAAGTAFSPGPDMGGRRAGCAIAALDAHRLIVVGGFDGERNLDSTEVLDVASMSFTPGPRLDARRAGCAAAALGNGSRVLVVGGFDGSGNLDSTEALNPGSMEFATGPELCSREDAEDWEP